MKISRFLLLLLCLAAYSASTGQRLKRADRIIVSNIEGHVAYLGNRNMEGRHPGSKGEKLADEYIRKQFERSGLKPVARTGWYQSFVIYDGREIARSTQFSINGTPLALYKEYFPFSFSASKAAEATVAVALAENGVPWFKDLKDILEEKDSAITDTLGLIRAKAVHAASKGATALVIYNSPGPDLEYDKKYFSDTTSIPVLYLAKDTYRKYCRDESAILDIKLNVNLREQKRQSSNVIGFADNGADSTIIAGAHLDRETDVAALIELARLAKNSPKKNNYLFVAYSGENKGANGIKYFNEHPPIDTAKVRHSIHLDTVTASDEKRKGLHLVKNSMVIIQTQ